MPNLKLNWGNIAIVVILVVAGFLSGYAIRSMITNAPYNFPVPIIKKSTRTIYVEKEVKDSMVGDTMLHHFPIREESEMRFGSNGVARTIFELSKFGEKPLWIWDIKYPDTIKVYTSEVLTVPDKQAELKGCIRGSLSTIVVVTAIAVGSYFTWNYINKNKIDTLTTQNVGGVRIGFGFRF